MTTTDELQRHVEAEAQRLEVPGVAVGILLDGDERYAFAGVTSVENPLPVDASTLFQFGSTGKTYTATAIMRLVERGAVDLDAPVRTYLPDFRLRDPDVAKRVTVLHLLNHTAGWSGDVFDDTGNGDDALARYVARLADVEQVSALGAVASYNNAALSVAGRILEVVTGATYEQAVRDLLLEPLGLTSTWFLPNDVMTRRFAVGHHLDANGTPAVSRPWALPRSGNPAGGMSSNAADQLAWARFHLEGGVARDGTQVLSEELVARMQQPTVSIAGSALGDSIGISWMLKDVDGVRLVGHGGDTVGQHASFVMVPERRFAFIALTNCGPNGSVLKEELERWAFATYLGIEVRDPEPVARSADELAAYAGSYETVAAWVNVRLDGERLVLEVVPKPEVLEQLGEDVAEGSDEDRRFPLGMLAGDGDQYIVVDGPAKGMRGYFVRDPAGGITGLHAGGRLATRAD